MSFDVFISYSTKDAIVAKAACAALESAKIRCWMAPRDIVPGAKWGASIVRAINECRVMVLIFSGNANDSSQVQREVDQAFSKAKTVVPLRIEDIKPADELAYYLDTVHWLDALTPPLERNLEKLVATVQALLPTTEQPSPSSEPAIDEAQAAKAQDEARAEDERRLKEAEAAESAETARREQEAAEAARRRQEAEAQRLAAEQRQKEEEKRRANEAARGEREQAEANERAEQERRDREAEAKERTEQEQAFAKAKSADAVAALDAFLAAYPASHLAAEVRALRTNLVEREETFKSAMASNDAVLLNAYLDRYPNGKSANQVRGRLRRIEHPLLWKPSRRTILIGGGTMGAAAIAGTVAVINRRSYLLRTFAVPSDNAITSNVVFARDGASILWGSHGGELNIGSLRTKTASQILQQHAHSQEVTCVAITPDGRYAVSGSSDKTLRLWDLTTVRWDSWDKEWPHVGFPTAVRTFSGHTERINSVAITPDGRTAISASTDTTLRLWDFATGKTISTLNGHSRPVTAVAIAPDGRTALSSAMDITLKLWSLPIGKLIRTFNLNVIPAPSDIKAPAERATFQEFINSARSVGITPDGKTALSVGIRALSVWDLASGAIVRGLAEGSAGLSLAITPDGSRVLTGGKLEGPVALWDIASGSKIRTFTQGQDEVAVAPDGRTALSASGKTIRFWDLT